MQDLLQKWLVEMNAVINLRDGMDKARDVNTSSYYLHRISLTP